jgi:hypothetical protein
MNLNEFKIIFKMSSKKSHRLQKEMLKELKIYRSDHIEKLKKLCREYLNCFEILTDSNNYQKDEPQVSKKAKKDHHVHLIFPQNQEENNNCQMLIQTVKDSIL